MDNQIINCRCGRERRNKESNWSGLIAHAFFQKMAPKMQKNFITFSDTY